MASVKKILLQLDCDPQPSTFDAVVAVDAGADVLLRHGGVTPENVVPLVHGVMFTRGGRDLESTAIFVGGSDVAAAEAVAAVISGTFFGPVRVGVLVDPSGANTTAAAAVLAAGCHLPLATDARPRCRALVLGGTGPVGQRVARLLGGRGATVAVASRHGGRADETVKRLAAAVPAGEFLPVQWTSSSGAGGLARILAETDLIVAAGAAGATLLDAAGRRLATEAKVLVDLNAVPPAGIEGVLATDRGREEAATVAYGAIGVGALKMRIHRAAIERIFSDASACLDVDELLAIGAGLAG